MLGFESIVEVELKEWVGYGAGKEEAVRNWESSSFISWDGQRDRSSSRSSWVVVDWE